MALDAHKAIRIRCLSPTGRDNEGGDTRMPTATTSRAAPTRLRGRACRLFERTLGSTRRWCYIGGLVGIAGLLLTWAFWPQSTSSPLEPPRARQYLGYTACLLTGERGVADAAAAPAWAGLQDGSLATKAKVQYLAIAGPQTADNAATFLNTLAQTGCNLIVAAGDLPVATVRQGAGRFPSQAFAAVTSEPISGNVIQITADDRTREAVKTLLTTAVAASGKTQSP
jgi:hypothetical protein